MAWIYAFAERGEDRYVKLGLARANYHERFEKTQQCNPVPMEIATTWRFPTVTAAEACERELKRGAVFDPWRGGGPEWFEAAPEAVRADPGFNEMIAAFGGAYHAPLRFAGSFVESLNLGARDRNGAAYRPHIYLIAEQQSPDVCKVALSCYNWPTVAAHYVTYNPRTLEIVDRWTFRDETTGKAFVEKLARQCLFRKINPLGWYRMKPAEMSAIVAQSGILRYPRQSPIDDRVHYTQFRVPVR